jgi:putative membrane protein
MKTRCVRAVCTLALVALASVASADQTSAPAQQSNAPAKIASNQEFVNQATIANQAEVQLGNLAAERAANADVKAYGQMMVKDHTAADAELKRIATNMKLTPTQTLDQKHQDLIAQLSKLRGQEFDRAYIDAMVNGHQEVVNMLRARAGTQMTSAQPTATVPAPKPPSAGTGQSGSSGEAAVGTGGANQSASALTDWARKTLPTVQTHLERARALQQTVSK